MYRTLLRGDRYTGVVQLWTAETTAHGRSDGLVIGIPVPCSCGQQKVQPAADLMGRASGCAEKCGTSTERTEKIINKRKSKEVCSPSLEAWFSPVVAVKGYVSYSLLRLTELDQIVQTCWVAESVIGKPLSAVLRSEESCLIAAYTRKAMPGDVRQNLL
ncbi:hypothetical protein B0H19DRAFT_1063169 [Mycena capillaripes]|nr:hypothetical protein B0H19DRAFT_1063169 [Mycena capillaripes]